MPDLPLPTGLTLISRRTALRVLAVVAVGSLTACRRSSDRAAPATVSPVPSPTPTVAPTQPSAAASATPTPTVAPLDPVVARAAAAERALLLAYDTALAARPDLAGALGPLRADHAAHLQGLLPGAVASPPAIAISSPVASTSASDLVVTQLVAIERAAATARLTDVAATGGSLARLLASISGCEAAHAALLVGT